MMHEDAKNCSSGRMILKSLSGSVNCMNEFRRLNHHDHKSSWYYSLDSVLSHK